MSALIWILIGAGVALVIYAGFVLALLLLGRRQDARALAGFVPDCLVLFSRLLREPGLSRRQKLPLALLMLYLALPVDLVPDFIPVAGQLDDVILAGWVLRRLVRGADPSLIAAHWPGPERSLALLVRLSGAQALAPT